ncbi:MAG TPA: EscU/YscU/HrcU family type III secretion system export apparatus switch protein [Rubrivivax sp.]|nr:EscU/YscU/HrcU family type III secretion system export apparatus switch protein [Rubrivivax sp.]
MADAQDRRLPATERKIRKARAEGQVARSRDLSHFAAIGAAAALLAAAAPRLLAWLQATLAAGLSFDARTLAESQVMQQRLALAGAPALWVVLGIGGAMALVALLAGVLSGGWNFSFKALAPKFQKVDPLAGLGRMLSGRQLVNTLKSCLLALIIGAVGVAYLKLNLPRFAEAMALPLPAALSHAGSVVLGGLLLLVLALALFAVVDVPLQRHQLARSLRMSVQEMKQEQRELEGNAELKQRQRARMREMANRRMLGAVPKADLVVMNPSHFAVALKYEEGMSAPRVVAKGRDLMALRIRDAAEGAQVPVLRAPPLARALYAHAELDGPVPAALFAAVAQVLAHVYQLRAHLQGRGAAPQLPEVQVPPELDPLHAEAEVDA